MKHSTAAPTKADKARFARLKEDGCICCRLNDALGLIVPGNVPEIHHLIMANRRRGHRFTICLCSAHHRGVCVFGRAWMNRHLGPSLAYGSKPFHAFYGSDDRLLELQDQRIGAEQIAA